MSRPEFARQQALVREFPRQLDAIMVSSLPNIRYLTGFSGSTAKLLVFRQGPAIFVSDFRYAEQSMEQVADTAERVIFGKKQNLWREIGKCLRRRQVKQLALENTASLATLESVKKYFKGKIITSSGRVEKIRQEKNAQEIELLRKAFQIADQAFADTLKYVRPGATETEIAARLEFAIRMNGGQGISFPTIIAAGEHAALPHASPGERLLQAGEMVKIDFGAVWQGYHSDMTRTVFLGPATAKFKEIYAIVLRAQKEAIKLIRPGAICCEVDARARGIIDDRGYQDNFGHGLGHALGLEVHEMPAFSPSCTSVLANGMALTVEPGIYIPAWGGIRIEDVFVVNDNKPIRLTNTPNALLELPV